LRPDVEIDYNNCPFFVTEEDFRKQPQAWLRGKAKVHIIDCPYCGGGRLASLSGYDEDGRIAMVPGPDEIREARRKKMGFQQVGNRYVLVKIEKMSPEERVRLQGVLLRNMRQHDRNLRTVLAEGRTARVSSLPRQS
jgi:hypothetical protein